MIRSIFVFLIIISFSFGNYKGRDYARQLGLNPKSKSTQEWFYFFQNEEELETKGVNKLGPLERGKLKRYLLDFASDSSNRGVSGINVIQRELSEEEKADDIPFPPALINKPK